MTTIFKKTPGVRRLVFLLAAIGLAPLLPGGCTQNAPLMRDGYYTAETVSYDADGWKSFLTIYVMNDRIVTAEFNARNISGLLKSWDLDHMSVLKARDGVHPAKMVRVYVADLLNKQNPAAVQPAYGDRRNCETFKRLAAAAVAQARNGSEYIVFVDTPGNDSPR